MKLKDFDKAYQLYNEIKEIILKNKANKTYKYEKESYLSNRDIDEETKNKYFRENGKVSFQNTHGEIIVIEISRWHSYKRWSRYGIYETPSFEAKIYVGNQIVWNLKSYCVDSFSEITSLEIPKNILITKEENLEQKQTIETITNVESDKEDNDILDTRILFEELNNAYQHYYLANCEKEKILLERKSKIEKSVEEIMLSYSKKIEHSDLTIKNFQTELNNYAHLITKYSTFDENLIGCAIAKLISIIENKIFIYRDVLNKYNKRIHGSIDSWDEERQTKASIIVDSDKYDNYSEYESKLNELVLNGKAIILSESNQYAYKNSNITFFTLNKEHIVCNINLENFNYIKDFINQLVQYRFERKLDTFSKNDMIICMQIFLSKYKEKILQNYTSTLEQKLLKLSL